MIKKVLGLRTSDRVRVWALVVVMVVKVAVCGALGDGALALGGARRTGERVRKQSGCLLLAYAQRGGGRTARVAALLELLLKQPVQVQHTLWTWSLLQRWLSDWALWGVQNVSLLLHILFSKDFAGRGKNLQAYRQYFCQFFLCHLNLIVSFENFTLILFKTI